MKVDKITVDGVVVVTLDGKLDTVGARAALEVLSEALEPGGTVVIDMTSCGYVASSGLRVLLVVAKQAAVLGARAVLCGVQPAVWDVILLTGFEDLLHVYPTLSEALAAVAPGEEAGSAAR